MAGTWRVLAGVVATLICAAAPADALGGGCWWYAPPAVSYYYYPPVYYYYYPRVFAVPDAAPASPKADTQKASSDKAPVIIATRGTASVAGERLKIGFWNLTGRDITLTVEGKSRTLAKNRSLSLELGREFSWQVERAPAHIERVPEGLAVHEVVIRD